MTDNAPEDEGGEPRNEPIDEDVTTSYLARILGVDPRSVQNYATEGMPKSAHGAYPLVACVQWYLERERARARGEREMNDLDQARHRKVSAEARIAEIDLAERQGDLIPMSVHERRLRERLETVDGHLRALGRYHTDIKAAVTDADADRLLERMSDEIRAELFGLSDEVDD